MKVPNEIEVWAAKDGSLQCDSRDRQAPLFPKGVSERYQLPIKNAHDAAVLLRCPEAFEVLVEGFVSSSCEDVRGSLDDALKHVAKYFADNADAMLKARGGGDD